ncbi:phage holin family protein [Fuscibacter oryzae]|uniref:Phage holin family protein n=1 Tax=Fuscibacter oryzae TaxID=2803939 RepID=A0A8J7MSR3_9RHOB|nr:phage holin family protein [Fuscibacter oryzae]MBL4929907.1 phage holin family protein [Fuscibacter oryzae]
MGRLALITALARLALRDTRRRIGQSLALAVLAALFLLISVASLAVALGIWLAQMTNPVAAALILSGGALVLGLLFLWLSGVVRRGRGAGLQDMQAEAGKLASSLKDEAAKLPPSVTLGAAGLAGLVLGLKLFGKK